MARSKPKKNILGLLSMLAPDTGPNFKALFDFMQIADEEMSDESDEIKNKIFMALIPTEGFDKLDKKIYRHHCQELIERVKSEYSMQLGTKAEVMIALSSTSLEVPLAPSYAKLYTELFNEIIQPAEPMEVGQYDWPDEGFELLDMLRIKTKQGWRK